MEVSDVNTNEIIEEMNFRDRVIKMSLGFNYLIVATATQCHIYNAMHWNAPTVLDLKDTVNFIMQSEKYFFISFLLGFSLVTISNTLNLKEFPNCR